MSLPTAGKHHQKQGSVALGHLRREVHMSAIAFSAKRVRKRSDPRPQLESSLAFQEQMLALRLQPCEPLPRERSADRGNQLWSETPSNPRRHISVLVGTQGTS